MNIDPRGILLTEKVDVAWLKMLKPQYFKDFIKFDILPEENKVFLGCRFIHIPTDCLEDHKKPAKNYTEVIYFTNR